jgi:phosphoglycolate phosphatase
MCAAGTSQQDPRGAALVVFDFDGTLADTWRDIATALNRTLREAGLEEVDGPDVRFWIGDGVRTLLARAVPQLEPSQSDLLFSRFLEHYARCCLDTTKAYPGVLGCIEALAPLPLAVASNKPTRFLEQVMGGLDLRRHFRVVLGGDALSVRKPDPGVLLHVAREVGAIDPGEIWMVGDSRIDVDAGRAVGAVTVGCAWGLRGREELEAAGVDHLVEDPAEIPPLILRKGP